VLTVAADGASATWVQLDVQHQYTQSTALVAFGAAVSLSENTASTVGGALDPVSVLNNGLNFPVESNSIYLWVINRSTSSVSIFLKPIAFFGSSPSAMVGASVIVFNQTFFLFGGLNAFASYCVNETWTQPITTLDCINVTISPWVKLELAYPPPVSFLGFATNRDKELLTFGGQGNVFPTHPVMWGFGMGSKLWHNIRLGSTAPSVRWGHTLAMFNETSSILFGGAYPDLNGSTGVYNDVWLWRFASGDYADKGVNGEWVMLSASSFSIKAPAPRAYHIGAVFESQLYVHGGCTVQIVLFYNNCTNGVLNDLWRFNPTTLSWTQLSIDAPFLYGHASVFHGPWLYLFHGYDASTTTSSVHKINVLNNATVSLTFTSSSPPARAAAMVQLFGHTDRGVVLFGGAANLSLSYNDTWLYAFEADRWFEAQTTGSIPQLFGAAMSVANDTVYIFGGANIGSSQSANNMYRLRLGCNPGSYSPDLLQTRCLLCPPGKYSPNAGASSCPFQCPSQLSTPLAGSTSASNCTVCGNNLCNGHGICDVIFDGSGPSRFTCTCTGWYLRSERDNCNTPVVGIIVSTILFAAAATVAVFFYCRWSMSNRQALEENYELNVKLLDDAQEGLREYKRVWEINFEEVELGELIAEGSFGAVRLCVLDSNSFRKRSLFVMPSFRSPWKPLRFIVASTTIAMSPSKWSALFGLQRAMNAC
jgi:hypothetical protein